MCRFSRWMCPLARGGLVIVLLVTASVGYWASGGCQAITTNPIDLDPVQEPGAGIEAIRGAQITLLGRVASGGFWVVRGSELLISTDSGATWSSGKVTIDPYPMWPNGGINVFVLDQAHAWSISPGPGTTESGHGEGPAVDHLHAIINRTSDAGKTWRQAAVPGDYGNHELALSFVDEHRGFLMCSAGRFSDGISTILRSDDGGASWSVVRSIRGGDSDSLGSQFAASDASTLWAGAQGEAGPVGHPLLEVSRDGGKTWSLVKLSGLEQRDGPASLNEPVYFLDASTAFVSVLTSNTRGYWTVVYRTADCGRTWSRVATNTSEWGDPLFAAGDRRHWFLMTPRGSGRIRLDATLDAGKT